MSTPIEAQPDTTPSDTRPVDPKRREMMQRVGRRDTGPEMVVRQALHAAGLRFRVQAKDLPGRPDVVFRSRRVAIFVHGCFWHRHEGCRLTSTPKTRVEFWAEKFRRNVERDERQVRLLQAEGWNVLIVWECETRKIDGLKYLIGHVRKTPVIGRSSPASCGCQTSHRR